MRYLTVGEYGQFLGTEGERLVVREDGKVVKEAALSRLRAVFISKRGVSFSSDLILACAARGIRLFILDWKNTAVAAISGTHQHGVAKFRERQFTAIHSPLAARLSAEIILAKIRNQRAVLNYYGKSRAKNDEMHGKLECTSGSLKNLATQIANMPWERMDNWRERLLGLEGIAARVYWETLAETGLLSATFEIREGRGSQELSNQMLNYGYTILTGLVWNALDNAGFELYAGLYHTYRPGKPSLVLDVMEEYRAWVVDRSVIKLRHQIKDARYLTPEIKKQISQEIFQTMQRTYPYTGKQIKLENILQRQVYRLAGAIAENSPYRGYRFRW